MAAGSALPPVAAVSVEEYLATSYKPACDYLDGVLRQKPMPTWKHGLLQGHFMQLINTGFPKFAAASEVTVRIREGKYFVPDVVVQSRDRIQDPYPTEPVHLCIEILSPDDRMSEVLAKCEEYHAWGVPTVWIADPDNERAWEYRAGQRPKEIAAGASLTADGIVVPLSEAFSVLHAR
jgi:Uma2 family endonuclease